MWRFHSMEVLFDSVGEKSVFRRKVFGKPQFHSCISMLSALQNVQIADLLEFAATEFAEAVSSRKYVNVAAKNEGKADSDETLG